MLTQEASQDYNILLLGLCFHGTLVSHSYSRSTVILGDILYGGRAVLYALLAATDPVSFHTTVLELSSRHCRDILHKPSHVIALRRSSVDSSLLCRAYGPLSPTTLTLPSVPTPSSSSRNVIWSAAQLRAIQILSLSRLNSRLFKPPTSVELIQAVTIYLRRGRTEIICRIRRAVVMEYSRGLSYRSVPLAIQRQASITATLS